MKHPSNREFFAYWDKARGDETAPDRSSLAPEGVRHLLGDIFVLSYDPAAGYPFRVAGTRTCALFGFDIKGRDFVSLFGVDSRHEIEDILGIVAEETLPTVAGVTADTSEGEIVHLELLLLPFSNRAHTPLSLTGLLAPFEDRRGTLRDLALTSWRHIHDERLRGPRAIRKWAIVRGLTVYEGLR
ncbi:MAG: PAS domain-containing protein [Bradyrhizobiaceae bacterium]|nr:MAG: PAS domain-containing protein [Bradyrhizobiaceae bacterium]